MHALSPAAKYVATRGSIPSPRNVALSRPAPSAGAPVAQQFARQRAPGIERVAARAAQHAAVDDDGVDAAGIRDQPVGAAGEIMDAAQRAGADGGGIEHHDIGRPALGEAAAGGG